MWERESPLAYRGALLVIKSWFWSIQSKSYVALLGSDIRKLLGIEVQVLFFGRKTFFFTKGIYGHKNFGPLLTFPLFS